MYTSGFYIKEEKGNNAIDYQKKLQLKSQSGIFVPGLRVGSLKELVPGTKTAFTVIENNKIKNYKGLKNFIKLSTKKIPTTYIFDNHNHAFFFWHLESIHNNLNPDATLIHIDQHKDTRIPPVFLEVKDIKTAANLFFYTNEILNVGNFIPAAQKTGLIKKIHFVDSGQSLETVGQKNFTSKNLILDIDMDFFSPDMSYIDEQKKTDVIRRLVPRAKLITVATSPYFMDQNEAIRLIKKIFTPLL